VTEICPSCNIILARVRDIRPAEFDATALEAAGHGHEMLGRLMLIARDNPDPLAQLCATKAIALSADPRAEEALRRVCALPVAHRHPAVRRVFGWHRERIAREGPPRLHAQVDDDDPVDIDYHHKGYLKVSPKRIESAAATRRRDYEDLAVYMERIDARLRSVGAPPLTRDQRRALNRPYSDHCWLCTGLIESGVCIPCPECLWYVCRVCGSCKANKAGGCTLAR
jgi:hypothetical protein